MKRFEVGNEYFPYAREYDPITVVRRTEKTIWVRGAAGNTWMMRIRKDANGNEYATDSTVPTRWREAFTYEADQ